MASALVRLLKVTHRYLNKSEEDRVCGPPKKKKKKKKKNDGYDLQKGQGTQ
jgi:hypothetical protein